MTLDSVLPKNKRILIVCIALVTLLSIVFSAAYFYLKTSKEDGFLKLTNPMETVHYVQLTEKGFVPNELVIRMGEKVVFGNELGTPFWPASSLHPTHEIYPEFDSKERILPPENWEFVFNEPGMWKYHDHINAHATGVIIVIDPDTAAQAMSLTDCAAYEGYQKQQCWDLQLEGVLRTQGLEAAFDFFVELYKTEPDVPKACHEWGHSLGKASYAVYKETGEVMLVPEASYCGYGYFHSFIAELVKDTGQFEKVLEFCDEVVIALEDELSGVADNCVHGVGHGTTAWLLENPENWGNFQKTADEGTAVCERTYTQEHDLQNCYDGVYNELHLDLFNDQYGLSFKDFMAKNDPFWICNEQKEAHKRACYFEFVGIFWSIFDLDFQKALTYVVENTHNLESRGPNVVAKIAADWIQFDIVNDSWERNIEACRTVPDFLFRYCMQGIANGFIQHGEPNNLHPKAFAFCSAAYLSETEQSLCFEIFLNMLTWHYSHEQFKNACALVADRFRVPQCSL